MTEDEKIIQEATEAVTKGIPCAFYVPLLLDVINRQKAQIEGLQDEVVIKTDMLNSQKAEIERLQKENKEQKLILEAINDEMNPLPFETDFDKAMRKAKSEAYREFADRLKDVPSIIIAGQKHYVIVETYFDNTLKELTEK